MPRPKEVDNAFWALCVAIGISIISSIVSIFETSGQVEENLEGTGVDPSTVTAVGGVAGLIIGLILAALGIFFGLQMRNGRNWARITLTVIGALVILGGLGGLISIGNTPISSILGVLQAIAAIAVIVFMWRGNAKHYFG